MVRLLALVLSSFVLYAVQSIVPKACSKPPIDLNTVSLSELDALPFISSSAAQSIIHIRPICSPLQLTLIEGITESRLNTNWHWYSDKSCNETCCLADATCDSLKPLYSSSAHATYSWKSGAWSDCSAPCNTGIQYRPIQCTNSTHTVHDAFCSLSEAEPEPLNKRLCNTHQCSQYRWIADKWSACALREDECIQTRSVDCYDTVRNTLSETDTNCEDAPTLPHVQSCSIIHCRPTGTRTPHLFNGGDPMHHAREARRMAATMPLPIDLLPRYNADKCHTAQYYIHFGAEQKFILMTRRGCTVDIEMRVARAAIAGIWVNAVLDAETDESAQSLFLKHYLRASWNSPTNTILRINIAIPSDGPIGKFDMTLAVWMKEGYYRMSTFTLYVLFNPYSRSDDTWIPLPDRQEYVDNTVGLLWRGSVNNNAAVKWNYDQFNYNNVEVSMYLLRRLALKYRHDVVLIARQISYAVAEDICYGKWSGPYTTGQPKGGYHCGMNKCMQPWGWRSTTELFALYNRMSRKYKVQYCQCWVYAAVTTTVGRALGIATRPVTNFQSAHDTDFNRAIEKYFKYSAWTKTWEEVKHTDSVWNFHVWNDMYFRRKDFTPVTSYVVDGWQAIDATPQEMSYGGNPAVGNSAAFQMGPASLAMIKENQNPSDCQSRCFDQTCWGAPPPSRGRFGCFDQEFVISEVNAYYNVWVKMSRDSPWKLHAKRVWNPTEPHKTIGQQMSTKKPGGISPRCSNEAISDCSQEVLDVTMQYKEDEPSGAGEPTDKTNRYSPGDTKRSMMASGAAVDLDSTDALMFNGAHHSIDLLPPEWLSHGSMMIAADAKDIIKLYKGDYTYAQMSLSLDSFYDIAKFVYCAFIVTAHDYRGEMHYSSAVKTDQKHFILEVGGSGKCVFDLKYSDYVKWIEGDDVDKPYSFTLSVSVALYDRRTDAESDSKMPSEAVVEDREVLVCVPKYKLAERIVCENGLIWAEPSYDLRYECEGIEGVQMEGVRDGFCDLVNNVKGCFDGGDCCATSCVATDRHKCEWFDCKDDRVVFNDKPYYECPKALSFIDDMNSLLTDEHCVDLETSIKRKDLKCSQATRAAKDTVTGNECFDRINAARHAYGDVKTCMMEVLDSIEMEMRLIIDWILHCKHEYHPSDEALVMGLYVNHKSIQLNDNQKQQIMELIKIQKNNHDQKGKSRLLST